MSINSNAPFALFKANQDFPLRIRKLLQEDAQLWQELGSRTFGADVAASKADLEQLSGNKDWQTLAAQSGEVFKRQWQQRPSDVEALTHAGHRQQPDHIACRIARSAASLAGGVGQGHGQRWRYHPVHHGVQQPAEAMGQPFAMEAAPTKKESARGK